MIFFQNHCLHPCNTPMAPNKFFHNLKWSLQAASLLIPCPACNQKFKSRGRLTKHLNQIHLGFEDNINEDASSVNSQHLGHSVSGWNAPDTPPQPQVQYPPSQAAPPPDCSSTHPNTVKKHCQYRFTFHRGFSKSYDSVDLTNPTEKDSRLLHLDRWWWQPSIPMDSYCTSTFCSFADYSSLTRKYFNRRFLAYRCTPQPSPWR